MPRAIISITYTNVLYSVPAIVIIQTIIYENTAVHATDMIKVKGYNFRQRPGSLQSGTVIYKIALTGNMATQYKRPMKESGTSHGDS